MVSHVASVAFLGVEARPIDVQVHIAPGLPAFTIVGLPDKAVGESRERVRAALSAIGLALPARRITVNLAPADLQKVGSHFDLPIAVGLLAETGAIPADILDEFVVIGELGLDGSIAPVSGALPAAMAAHAMGRSLLCPKSCGAEAAWAGEDLTITAPGDLGQLINHIEGRQVLDQPRPALGDGAATIGDLADIRGQEAGKRALEIAAAGGHNLLFVGTPGAGKSMLASRLASILPPMTPAEMLETAMIRSVAGDLVGGALTQVRPFRAPHHSASMAAMVGGGARATPGEAALAHNGVLFLDELPEFSPQVLDSLRQPLENGETVIARANFRVAYPSRFQLVAAMNPCKCGYAGEPGHTCRQGERCAESYQARLSGPFLDRIDMHVDIPPVSAVDMMAPAGAETSADVRERVVAARAVQAERYAALGLAGVRTNAACPPAALDEVAALDGAGLALLRDAADRLRLSARGYHRVLRLSRTLADLSGAEAIARPHVAEALAYRFRFQNAALAAA